MCPTTRRQFVQLTGTATLAGLAGCGGQASTETPTPADVAGVSAADIEVSLLTDNQGSYFQPKGLLLDPGTTVQFANDAGVHTATAYHPDNGDLPLRIPTGASPFDSGVLNEEGDAFEVTLETPGVYDFVCVPHESLGMVGRFVVGEVDAGPGTTPPESLPPAARESLPPIEAILQEEVVNGP